MSSAGITIPFFSPIDLAAPRRLFERLWSSDLAMDLGTANTLIYMKGRGIILNEPSVVAIDEQTRKAVAIGHAAKRIFGKTSRSIRCVRPMKDGVIADFETTAVMIQTFLKQVAVPWCLQKPRVVIGVPSGITQVEKRAVIDASMLAGVRGVMLVEEPMAAALGADLPIDKAVGNMIVDIGGGTTEVAVISMGGTAYSHSIRVAGDEMDEAIERMLRREYGVQIGIFEAERIKLLLGSALPFGMTRTVVTTGREITTGIPRQLELNDEEVREALSEPVSAIIASITTAMEQTSPEMAHDIMTRGIHLAGGGALLKGLDERLYRETGVCFHRASDPLSCVVRGVGKIIENLREFRQLCIA